jgi:DNA replication and repair protein RecF
MFLKRLQLTHFKNYPDQQLLLSPGINCLVGLNGMGKTNVLDAVHFLCLTKSHKGIPDKLLVQHDAPFLRVEGIFENNDQPYKVVIKMPADKRKELEVNGTPIHRLADHIGRFPAVMIAPDDVDLVQEGSEERRRYWDATLSQVSPEYLAHLMRFNALLKQRNALLKQFGAQRYFDATLLESIDHQLPQPAAALQAARAAMLSEIGPVFEELYRAIAGGRERAGIEMVSDWPEQQDYAAVLKANLDRDRYSERTSSGPHRDDIAFLLDGFPLKKFASQGQLKSFLLALRLAQFEYLRTSTGQCPILLLDDIFDKLDSRRVQQLVALLLERKVEQVLITDTQRARIEGVMEGLGVPFFVFEVSEGRI